MRIHPKKIGDENLNNAKKSIMEKDGFILKKDSGSGGG